MIVKLIYSLLILFFIFSPLYAENYGSISGKVTGEKSGEGIPGVVVEVVTINSVIDIKTKTDSEGRYSFDKLTPDTYYLNFFPGHPYCVKNEWDIHKVRIEAGKKVVLNKTLELGGAISGKVYKEDGKTSFEGISVHVISDYSEKTTRTKADGSYYFGDLCPSLNYYINVSSFGGSPYKALTGVSVVKGKEIKVKDIVFNLNDVTGIEGYITSSCDGGPFENAECSISKEVDALNNKSIPIGDITTDKNGYYRMKGMEPGTYWVWIRPPLPPKKDAVTGKPFFSMQSYGRYFTWGKTVVEKGRVTRMDMKLNIPSYSKTMKTQVDVRLIYGKDSDKQPYRIIFEASGSGQGMLPYIKKKIIKDQFNYRFVGISPGRYWFGLSFLENTNGGENEKIYSNITSSWREVDRRIFIPWDYKVIIEVLIQGKEIDLKKKSKKSIRLDVITSVDLIEILKKRKERTFYYKFEVTRKMNKK